MNRYAAVLAADSATTVSYGYGDTREERYFKGANKIFQLSDHHPVGMMVFDSAALLQVPWEIIVKTFRRQLGQKSFNSLSEYAEEFFSFLEGNTQLFPEHIRHGTIQNAILEAGLALLLSVQEQQPDKDLQTAAVDDAIERNISALDAREFPGGLNSEDIDAVMATIGSRVEETLPLYISDNELPAPTDIGRLVRLSALEVIKDPDRYLTTTGLVFSGYGDHDVFPSMVEFASAGMVLGRFVRREASHASVDYERPASIKAFAQTSMTDTFTLGVSMDVFMSLSTALNSGLRSLVAELFEKAGVASNAVPDLNEIIAEKASTIRTTWLDAAREDHQWPMRRVLASLPIDELAELAETLIRLQSLKEKVTKPSETVGGPVDVAVITKNEGLVWIRRKHYFDGALNPRYMKRLGA